MKLSFNYQEVDEWISYIKEFIVPIRENANIILQFWDYLLDNFHSKTISYIINDENILNKLLGGVTIHGDYQERSAAKFYKIFFGWELKDVVSYLNNKEYDIEIDIPIDIKKTQFIEFVTDLMSHCITILDIAYDKDLITTTKINNNSLDFDFLIKSDEEVIKLIGDLYRSIIRFSVLYNEKTLFLWTLKKNTKHYIKFQYELPIDNNDFNILKEKFDFDIFFSPDLDDKSEAAKNIKDQYSIWYLRENGLGNNINKLNKFIFEKFKDQLLVDFKFLISNTNNFENEYIDYISMKLNFWSFPDYIDTSASGKYQAKHYEYLIEGIYMPYSYIVEYRSLNLENINFNKSLLEMLDDIAPGLFLSEIEPENLIFNTRDFEGSQKLFLQIKK